MPSLWTLAFPEFSETDRRFLRGFRAANSPAARVAVEPHFTLLFACDQVSEQEYAAHVADIAKRTEPIDFVCQHARLAADDQDDRVHVFLVPEEGLAAIARLHDRLYTGPLADFLRPDPPYVPHITVGTLFDRLAAQALCGQLNDQELRLAGTIKKIVVGTVLESAFRPLSEHRLGT